jgi:hypothetical protein
MSITRTTIKDHGPCATCGHEIRKGTSMRTGLRAWRPSDKGTGVKEWRGQIPCKTHYGCPHPDRFTRFDNGTKYGLVVYCWEQHGPYPVRGASGRQD